MNMTASPECGTPTSPRRGKLYGKPSDCQYSRAHSSAKGHNGERISISVLLMSIDNTMVVVFCSSFSEESLTKRFFLKFACM